jgi:hypothetical protein
VIETTIADIERGLRARGFKPPTPLKSK